MLFYIYRMYVWLHTHFDLINDARLVHHFCFRGKHPGRFFLSLHSFLTLALRFSASDLSTFLLYRPATLQPSLSLRTRYVL